MRDAAQLRPLAKRADGWLVVLGKDSADAESDNVRELAVTGGHWLRVHAACRPSTDAAGAFACLGMTPKNSSASLAAFKSR